MKLERMKIGEHVTKPVAAVTAGELVMIFGQSGYYIITAAAFTKTDGRRGRLMVSLKDGTLCERYDDSTVIVCEGKLSVRPRWETLPEGIVDDGRY